MSSSLTFMMGEFCAEFPCDRSYIKNHMWAMPQEHGVLRFGFSAYAVRLLQDVYFIDFDIAVGSVLTHRQEFGSIESKKAESGMYAPIAGQITAINEQLLDDPSLINVDKYGAGWLIEMSGADDGGLLNTGKVFRASHLRVGSCSGTIKGQANTDD